MNDYDIIILGGGPGGYVAAIKAAQLGAKVAVVERERLGGVCLNWGCIPTKTLLNSAKQYTDILRAKEFGIVGIDNDKLSVDWNLLLERKDGIVNKLVSGIEMLFKKNKIDLYKGLGKVVSKNEVEINGEKITGKNLIIATGARDRIPDIPGLLEGIESGKILGSKATLQMDAIPKDIVILGGSVYGIEYATLFNAIGSNVVVIMESDHILPGVESEMALTLERQLKKSGVKFVFNAKLKSFSNEGIIVEQKEKEKVFIGDKYLLSFGLTPNIEGFEHLNIKTNSKGFIETNEKLETHISGIYAVGDINGKYPLAHVASAEGIVAAENIMGKTSKLNYNIIPLVIYTFPELASVGLSEEQATEKGLQITVSKFPLAANGKAMSEGETVGFIKVISDNKYGEIVGTHIMANAASDMITSAVAIMQLEGTVYDMAKTILPHPTTSEIFMEAAFGSIDKPIHM